LSDLLNVLLVGLLLGGIYSLVSIGLNLIFGVIRVVNFAQGEFVMLGMYAAFAAFSFLHMDPYLSVLLVFPALFVLGRLVQRFIIQPLQNEPMMQVFATFGLLMVFQNVVLALTRGASVSVRTDLASVTFAVGGVQVSLVRLIALVAATAVAAGCSSSSTAPVRQGRPRRRPGPAGGAPDGHRRRAHLHADLRHRRRARRPRRRPPHPDLHPIPADRRQLHPARLRGGGARRARQRHRRLSRRFSSSA
jgi:hypothetical protein